MLSVPSRRLSVRALLLWAAPAASLSCGGGGTEVVLPSLSVTTSTQGVELDPDGYSLLVDGANPEAVGVAGTLVVERLQDGDHLVELAGMASNCAAQGENPRTVNVRSGATSTITFQVTCAATVGSIEVAASTSGGGSDPDGYLLLLDGSERGPIAGSGVVRLDNISLGAHSIGLTGLAGNCQVAGDNPRTVTVSASQAASVPFSITCVVPGPTLGTLEISTSTTGSTPDPDGYTVALDGAAGQPIGAAATLTLSNLPTGTHRLVLQGIADNCTLNGNNPRNLTITAGQTTRIAFAITCTTPPPPPPPPPEAGGISVSVSTSGGTPDPDGYTVTVDNLPAQNVGVNGSRTVQALAVGAHTVLLGGLASNCRVEGDNPRSATVTAGQTVSVAFAVTCAATAPPINLRVERMYLTQSVQRLPGDIPLVQGRDGLLRVFVTASGSNNARPAVRVRLYQNGGLTRTLTISASGASTPTSVQQDGLGSSWNVSIPGSLITPGASVLADVDPDNQVAETNEGDNTFPASSSPQSLSVQSAAPAAIRFVPILQTANNLQGTVTNPAQLVELVRRMYPLNGVSTEVRSVFTVTGPLQPSNANGQWDQILSDLEALRVADNATDRTYYGLVRLDYGAGIVGNGFVGAPSAIGTDNGPDVRRVVAHELGHTWGEYHTPCGNPPGIDPDYPYPSGNIGVYGYDGGAVKMPSLPDIMGYCSNPWISDYVYERVMAFRRAGSAAVSSAAQPCLLVWGHIADGRPVLEPAFQVVTRPHLPKKPGAYSLEGQAADGSRLFGLSFDAIETADGGRSGRHFAFAVPLGNAAMSRIESLRLIGPGAAITASAPAVAQLRTGATPEQIEARRDGAGVSLRWNRAAYPMILVRDPDTGEILSFARGGSAMVATGKSAVELDLSDGVRSQRVRRAISR